MVREIYRVNKLELNDLLIAQNKRMDIMMVYTHKEILRYEDLLPAVVGAIKKLRNSVTIKH